MAAVDLDCQTLLRGLVHAASSATGLTQCCCMKSLCVCTCARVSCVCMRAKRMRRIRHMIAGYPGTALSVDSTTPPPTSPRAHSRRSWSTNCDLRDSVIDIDIIL